MCAFFHWQKAVATEDVDDNINDVQVCWLGLLAHNDSNSKLSAQLI